MFSWCFGFPVTIGRISKPKVRFGAVFAVMFKAKAANEGLYFPVNAPPFICAVCLSIPPDPAGILGNGKIGITGGGIVGGLGVCVMLGGGGR